MTGKVFLFVRHHEVAAYQRIGWQRHDSLDGTHHGYWSALMEWKGAGEPVNPLCVKKPPPPDVEADALAEAVRALDTELGAR